MAPPIVNPYTKTTSPSTRTASGVVRTTSTSSPRALPNHHHTNQKKRPVRPWEAAAAQQAQHNTTTTSSTSSSHDDLFDDGGMDWDQAARVLEDAVAVVQQQDNRGGTTSSTRQQQQPPPTNPYQKARRTATTLVDSPRSPPQQHQPRQESKKSNTTTGTNREDDADANEYSFMVMDPRKNPSPGCVRGMDPRKAPSPGTAFSLLLVQQPHQFDATGTVNPTVGPGMVAGSSVPKLASSYGNNINNNGNQQRPPRPPTAAADATNRTAYSKPAPMPGSSGGNPVAPVSAISSSRPPRPGVPSRANENPPNHAIVASLRPAAWTQSNHQQQAPAPTTQTAASPGTSSVGSLDCNNRHSATEKTVDPLQLNLPQPLQFTQDQVQPVTDAYRPALVQHAALTQPLLNGWTLFSHQKRAILAALLMRRMILALDMGLGKTLIGCCWARAFVRTFAALKVVVICPVSLKKEWQRTLQDAVGLTVFDEAESTKKQQRSTAAPDAEVIVASWAKVPAAVLDQPQQLFVVVADEAHSMQSMAAARTRDALQLMLAPNCIGVLLLTGTPMKNGKPANLFPLLKAVQHPLGRHQRAFEAHFCGGRDVQFGRSGPCTWQATGATHLEQLRALTQSHLLHLTKADCLKTLPPQTRVHAHVPVSRRAQWQHTQALQKLARVYSGGHANHNSSSTGSSQEAILGAVQNLRMVDSLAKVEATVQTCRRVLEKEPAVVVFTSFQQVAKLVHQKLSEAGWPGELLTGETPPKKRQGLVDNFQSGLSSVFVSTFGAGGVGLTLTAAHTVVLVDRPWTPGDAHQAEDRVRRIGQIHPVTSIWMSAFELDEQIDAMLESKAQTAQAVLAVKRNNDSDAAADPALAKLSIFKLLQSVLPPPSSSSSAGSVPDSCIA